MADFDWTIQKIQHRSNQRSKEPWNGEDIILSKRVCGVLNIGALTPIVLGLILIWKRKERHTLDVMMRLSGSSALLRRPRTSIRIRVFSAKADEKPKGAPYSSLKLGIPKETFPLEKRVAATPESIQRLVKPGFQVVVEDGAGEKAFFSNADYEAAGATIAPAEQVWKESDIVMKLRPPTDKEVEMLEDRTLISFLYPKQNEALVKKLRDQKSTAFAMDCIPRTLSRGQTYDALSSQANISGYRAVLEASNEFGRFFAGQMTAAGKVPPAKVLVIGTGVAGLAAIQTAKNMGAVVRAFDVRPVTKEQVEGELSKLCYSISVFQSLLTSN